MSNVGSAGDAHPFIALGAALLAAGHQVSMASHDEHQAEIEAARIEFISLGQDLSYQQAIDNPNLWHSIKGMGVLWRNLLAPSIVPLYRLIESLQLQGRAQMVIAAPQMLGARLAQEHLSSRYLSAYTSPNMLRTHIAPTSIAHWHLPKGMPRWCVRTLWQAIDHYKLTPMARKAMAHTGEALNLPMPPVQDIFSSWMHSSLGSLALFPDWYGAAAPDWPARPAYAGFPLYDLDARQALSPELEDFLNAGPPPVVVMPGSANQFGQADFAAWQRVLSRKGLRGVFIGANSALTETSASAFLAVQYAPFSLLLPRSAVLCHHGGIGTLAQAMRAGIAQFIRPKAHDQFDNGQRVQQLGLGCVLRTNNENTWEDALDTWLAPNRNQNAIAACAKKLQLNDFPSHAARIVESFAP
ncbi:MAG: hypothetical protein HC765_06985 [Brachymonas sp.]|nr:hypothetical protein [Brachymonas sp.]